MNPLIANGLDQLREGFGVFDSDLRLVSCNRPYRELRDYPAELCKPGVLLAQMIRFNAERGDFGEGSVEEQVAERMAEIAQTDQREIEREMANGQVLKIRYHHMDAAGLVVMFQDITDETRAQRALAASEERYALVAEAAEEAIYEWDIEQGLLVSSPHLERMLGIKNEPDGMRDWAWIDLVHPDDQIRYKASLQAHLSGEVPRWECEYRIKTPNGEYRWISDHGTSIRNTNGDSTRMIAAVRDITEQIERNAALAASEERHALVARATSDGLYDWDLQTDTLYVSDRLNSLFGFDDLIRKSRDWADRIHEDDLAEYKATLRAHFKGNTEYLECEYRISGSSNEYLWVHDHGSAVRSDDNRVVRLVGAVRDVTEIKAAQLKVEHAETRLLDSLETISDGFLLVGSDGLVKLWNRRYLEIFGDAAGGDISDIVIVGKPFIDMIREGYGRGMFKPHPDGVEGWIENRRTLSKEASADLEIELNNGRWLQINERAMSDGGRVSVYADISDFKTRESELEAARGRFEDAIEALSSGFVLFDSEDRIVVCNTKYREYFSELSDMVEPGTAFVDIIEAAVERDFFPDAVVAQEGWLADLLERRSATSGVREQYMKSGLWLQISDHRTKDGGIVSIYTDVSELKNREAELSAQSAILEATLENMGQAISMVDDNLNVVIFNEKFLEFFEFPEKDFKRGFHMSQAFRLNASRGEYGEGDVEEQIRERLELSAKFMPHRFERTRPDGVVFEIVGNPVETGGFVTTYTDITERKQAEQILVDREAQLSAALQEFNAVLDTIKYGVLFMGPDLRARIINRAFGELWGISQEFIDRSPSMQELIEYNRDTGVYDIAAEDWDDWVVSRVDAVRKGDIPATVVARADGKMLQYQVISLPDGGRMLTYFDITELKQRENELIAARDDAEAALNELQLAQVRLVQAEKMASLGQLTAGIAHEIKNPLNFVNNFARLSNEMLEELSELLAQPLAALGDDDREDAEGLFDTVKSNLTKIDEHGRRADSIVKNMLLHSRDGPSEIQRSNINAIVEEALNLTYHGARAEDPTFNIEMEKSLADDLGEIECFQQDLMRVFLNLFSNGMYAATRKKASEPVTAPLIKVDSGEFDDGIVVNITDNGAGIPDEIREKVFTPFFTTKPPGEGTGLGLSLSYDIVVKQHGGTMSVESQPGEFTTFTVTLPRLLKRSNSGGGITA